MGVGKNARMALMSSTIDVNLMQTQMREKKNLPDTIGERTVKLLSGSKVRLDRVSGVSFIDMSGKNEMTEEFVGFLIIW